MRTFADPHGCCGAGALRLFQRSACLAFLRAARGQIAPRLRQDCSARWRGSDVGTLCQAVSSATRLRASSPALWPCASLVAFEKCLESEAALRRIPPVLDMWSALCRRTMAPGNRRGLVLAEVLVCPYARSLGLKARQNTPAIDGAFYRPNDTSYQLQPSFHPQSTEPEPMARARRAGEEFY